MYFTFGQFASQPRRHAETHHIDCPRRVPSGVLQSNRSPLAVTPCCAPYAAGPTATLRCPQNGTIRPIKCKELCLSSPPCALTADQLLPSVAITHTNSQTRKEERRGRVLYILLDRLQWCAGCYALTAWHQMRPQEFKFRSLHNWDTSTLYKVHC